MDMDRIPGAIHYRSLHVRYESVCTTAVGHTIRLIHETLCAWLSYRTYDMKLRISYLHQCLPILFCAPTSNEYKQMVNIK